MKTGDEYEISQRIALLEFSLSLAPSSTAEVFQARIRRRKFHCCSSIEMQI